MRVEHKARKFAKALTTRVLEFDFERMPYRLEAVSSAKLLTLFRQELNCTRRRPQEPWYPVQLQVEPSAVCSLRCPLCPAGSHGAKNGGSLLPLQTFKSLIDEVGDHSIITVFWMWGEPFMNPELPDMISYAHGRNIGTVTSTNGQQIQTLEEAEKLVISGLDNLVVAVDGATQETYGRYRVSGDLQKVFRCLELIRQAKTLLGSEKPRVNVRTVVNKDNEPELDELRRIGERFGADFVSRKTAAPLDHAKRPHNEDFAPRNPAYRRFRYRNGKRIVMPAKHFRCRRQWKRISLRASGAVIPCEFDCNDTAAFGHAGNGGSFMDIWKGGKAKAFREQFLIDRMVNPFCAGCPLRDRIQNECTVEISALKM